MTVDQTTGTPSTRSHERNLLARLTAPAVQADEAWSARGAAALRVLVGLMWLFNLYWKRPPDFGRNSGHGLYGYTRAAVDYPVLRPYGSVVEHLVLPHFTAFAWVVLAAETALAVLLLTGTAVRLAALLGIAQTTAITLSALHAPGEWPWSYYLMIGAHAVLLVTASGRIAAVDGMRADPRTTRPRSLLIGWAAVFAVAGIAAGLRSLGHPLASTGATAGFDHFSIGLGTFNLLGAAVLLVIAALLLLTAQLSRPAPAVAAAVVAAGAAGSIYLEVGFHDVLLGGSETSAAWYLCGVVVAAAVAARLRSGPGAIAPEAHGDPAGGADRR